MLNRTVYLTLLVAISLAVHPLASACESDYSIWQIRDKSADPYYRIVENGKVGYIDRTGKVVMQPTKAIFLRGNYGGEFHDGLVLTGVNDGPYLNIAGKVALTTKYEINWDFSEGLAAAMRSSKENRWGFIDHTGKFVIAPKVESYPHGYVYSFSNGVAMVEVEKKFGYIDKTGNFTIQPSFLWARSFSEDRARVIVSGPCRRPMSGEGCDFGETLGAPKEGEKVGQCEFGFIDRTGSAVGNLEFDNARDFSEGLAAVQKEGKWGFIDKSGKLVIPFTFGSVGDFSDGLALAAIGSLWETKKWGYIDKTGKLVIPYKFARADNFADGVAPIAIESYPDAGKERYFYIGKNGERAFPGTFRAASPFFKGIGHVKLVEGTADEDFSMRGKYAYLDTNGRIIFKYARGSEE